MCAVRHDAAPSRWAYRWQRLWLTPLYRRLIRTGLPLALIAGTGFAVWSDPARREAISGLVTAQWQNVKARPEFTVTLMEVTGASAPLDRAVREMFPGALPASSLDLDLETMKQGIESLDAVASADLRVRAGGVLAITITERVPALLWRSASGGEAVEMLDASGHRVATLRTRESRADLPLVAGHGAPEAAAEALALFEAAGPLKPRLRGLVRVGERRWDMVFTGDQRVLLPASEPAMALERLILLDQAESLLTRDVTLVDLRLHERPVVRLTEAATVALGRRKASEKTQEPKAPVEEE